MNRFQKRQAKRRARTELQDGQVVRVTRFCENGDVTYWARVVLCADGTIDLEPLKGRVNLDPKHYSSTVAIDGYRDWYLISSHPVLLAPHARIRVMTRRVMEIGMTATL